ncbi:hypothetical protein B0H14DRAFT_2741925 [Mycena olivaceomarginata]|nr:hypothetical protein B0H14DRAFT_2741925 [Mycena olivaceomarginata]
MAAKLANKTRNQIKDCYVVLATAGLLVGPMNNHLVQLCSQTLYESFKVTNKNQPRTPEERKVWKWRRALQRTFFNKLFVLQAGKDASFPSFEPKPLSEEEVIAMKELFDKMGSDTVSQVVIKSTSITKVLRRICTRGDDFAIKAEAQNRTWNPVLNRPRFEENNLWIV